MDTTDCDREPIHVPGSIQPHGVLVVLDERDLRVLQVSENVRSWFGPDPEEVLGQPLARVIGEAGVKELVPALKASLAGQRPVLLPMIAVGRPEGELRVQAICHRADGGLVLELERAAETGSPLDLHALVDGFSLAAEATTSIDDLCRLLAIETRRLTGFDRVLIYRFDEGWNGTVVGEDGNGRLPSLLDHRFPASDIPAQARELYRINRIRIIPDSSYRPVAMTPRVNPVTGGVLDMSFATLRSVSPVHVEYMKNMETVASMSVSILRDGKLWGLVSCHHREPRMVPFAVRGACDLFARAFSLRLSALEYIREYERRIEVRSAYSKLLAEMTDRGDFAAALAEHSEDLIAFAGAQGAAVLSEGGCLCFGKTPTEAQVRGLADWLFRVPRGDVYHSECLAAEHAPAAAFKDTASGVLAAAISKLHPSYLLWFRPEVIRTIKWGGNPSKPVDSMGGPQRLHPRRSFETWKETVRDRSLPWDPSEVEGAGELRNAIVGIVLRKAEEMAALNAELLRSNKELEAFSYSVSHDLRAPLRHIVGYAEMVKESPDTLSERSRRCIDTIIESSEYAGQLVDKLLGFSRLGRLTLQPIPVNMNVLVDEVRTDVIRDAVGRRITWRIGELPSVQADLMMLRMMVRDLLSNAVKYTRGREEAVIEVSSRDEGTETVFSVADNGVGFDMEYVDKLFGVFQRLHRWEDYEGTGIGLANVRRVVERHGGRTWAEGVENQGATFYFSLPKSVPAAGDSA